MVTRWWVVLCVAVLWDTVSLQPVDDQQKPKECCPCPKDASGAPLTPPDTPDSLADQAGAGTTGAVVRAAVGAVDDCPCRFRDADSLGAPSLFFPAAVRAVRPFVNLEDSKENPDPLLHPEVNLASSVLETLRQATDEEYEDALARDAARSAVDGEAQESARNLVTVLINPKDPMTDDDVMSEASHVHEARCINPSLGRSSLRTSAFKPILLTDILNLPKRKSPSFRSWSLFDRDSGVGASNVNERVVKPDFDDGLQFRSTPEKSSAAKTTKPMDKFTLKVPAINFSDERPKFNTQSVLPKSRTTTKLEIPNVSNIIPKLKTPDLRRVEDKDASVASDSQNAASIFKERFVDFTNEDKENALISKPVQATPKPKTLSKIELPSVSNLIPKLNTPNLLWPNKDESIRVHTGNRPMGAKTIPPSLKNTPSKNRDATSDFLSNLLRGLEVPNLSNIFSSDNIFNQRNNDLATKSSEQKEILHETPDKKPFVTEILDTVPSPSEIKSDHISFDEVEEEGGINTNVNAENEEIQNIVEQNPLKTEIIDHIPNSSNLNEMNNPQINILTDTNAKAKDNTVIDEEQLELNNEMLEINDEDIVDDTITNESERQSFDFSENIQVSEQTEFDSNNFGTEFSQTEIQDEQIDEQIDEQFFGKNADNNQPLPLRERIRTKLDNLKNRPKTKEEEEPQQMNTQMLDSLPSKENKDQVDIEDLQQMSDTLLDKERLRDGGLIEDDPTQIVNDSVQGKLAPEKVLGNENDEFFLKDSDNSMDMSEVQINNGDINNDNKDSEPETLEEDSFTKTDLPNDRTSINAKNDEMESEASERVVDTIDFNNPFQMPLREIPILQPPSLNDLNVINLPPIQITDVININNPLPALKLPNLFNTRNNADIISSTSDDEIDDLGAKLSMSPSIPRFRSTLPPLKPLEDINLDILQLKPLGSELPTIPGLNLNHFKTKLAIPESLQLRPLLLESSVGNKEGVVGASWTFGSDDKQGINLPNMLGQASLKKPSILGRPLGDLPSFDELRSTMWENAHNLLNTPLETTSRNAVEDTLRSGQVLSENLRVGAENTVKDIQKNLQSTLKGVGLTQPRLLSSTAFRSPNDFFEELSRKHEDVNDKLKGISYDLSDRLETLRNSLLDDYRLPSLRSSLFDGIPLLGSPMSKQSSLAKSKSKSSSYPNKGKKVNVGSASGTKGKFIARSSADKNKLKMPAAQSIASVKTIKPNSRNVESPIFTGLAKESKKTLPAKESPTLGLFQKGNKNTIDTSRSFLKKPSLPKLGHNNIKISFATTPSPPILKSKPKFNGLARSSPTKKPITLPTLPKKAPKDKTGLITSFRDSSGRASEPVSTRIKAPLKQRFSYKNAMYPTLDEELEKEVTVHITTPPPPATDPPGLKGPKPPTLNKKYTSNSPKLNPDANMKTKHPTAPDSEVDTIKSEPLRSPLSWPRTLDDNFLGKVRDALRARLAGLGQGINANPRKSSINLLANKSTDADMARSASNNIELSEIGPVAMKENTAYTCKMMCTKNS